jgi:hypothetical protein
MKIQFCFIVVGLILFLSVRAHSTIAEDFCGVLSENETTTCNSNAPPNASECSSSGTCTGAFCNGGFEVEVNPNWTATYKKFSTSETGQLFTKVEVPCFKKFACKGLCENTNNGNVCVRDPSNVLDHREINKYNWVRNLCVEF